MTDNNGDAGSAAPVLGDPNATGSQLALQAVYLKDCSYEAPNGPRLDGQWNPQINLDLHTGVNILTPELREIVLTVTVSAKQNESTMFLVEVKQAGAFLMRNLTDDDARRACEFRGAVRAGARRRAHSDPRHDELVRCRSPLDWRSRRRRLPCSAPDRGARRLRSSLPAAARRPGCGGATLRRSPRWCASGPTGVICPRATFPSP